MSLDQLVRGAAQLNLPLRAAQIALFEQYRWELLDWNSRVNLTSVTTPEQVETRHFLDSLTCYLPVAELLKSGPTLRMIDVGSGAGFPGIPMKIAFPQLQTTLLDSVRKKTAFLEHLVTRLKLPGVSVLTGRAEELARQPEHRDSYDLAVSRALASLPVLLELCLPFVKRGGLLVAPRRGDLVAQQHEAEAAARELGGFFRAPVPIELAASDYGLVVVDKVHLTPERYPRRAGIPTKRPLSQVRPG